MKKNNKVAYIVTMVVLGMFAFAFAAFPLYSLFCKVTGYGGTPKKVDVASHKVGNKYITVRFNADTDKDLPWKFNSLQSQLEVLTGDNRLAFFSAENLSNEKITGMAIFNVVPDEAGQYFHKIQCFCFEKQTLDAGEKVQMPVSFYIDPEIEKDPALKDIDTVTLSYSFFRSVP